MIGITYQNMGVAHTYKKDLDSSIYYLDKAYNTFNLMDEEGELPSLLNAYADAYFICGPDYINARKYASRAEQLALQYNSQENLAKIYLLSCQIERCLLYTSPSPRD